ncbi:hypothetical protein [Polaromonas sp.]|uniref:hypothetical protein n=1 Tax=Polaromonas sp. TaxID=1869339 RepID=UPI002FC693CE
MSFFNWFSGKTRKPSQATAKSLGDNDSSGLTRDDERTRPIAGRERTAAARPERPADDDASASEGRKTKRHARRELLYVAVRESMTRAGVLSASYKFKVLSLDQRGNQFLVMMDLAQEFGGQTERLAEIEAMIAQTAKARFDIRVTAVYWRMNELVSVGRPIRASQPAALAPAAPAFTDAAPPQARPGAPRYEPIQADEVAAFKQALAAASAQGLASLPETSAPHRGPRSYTLLTGFEDTEMAEEDASTSPALSTTQYGDLN